MMRCLSLTAALLVALVSAPVAAGSEWRVIQGHAAKDAQCTDGVPDKFEVILYQDILRGGKSLRWCHRSFDNLHRLPMWKTDDSWGDQVSSLRIVSMPDTCYEPGYGSIAWRFVAYTDAYHEGYALWTEGSINDLRQWDMNDSISSIAFKCTT